MEYPKVLLDNTEVGELRNLARRMYKGADRASEIINSFERQLNALGMKIPALCGAPFYGIYYLMWNKNHTLDAAENGGAMRFRLFVTQTQVSIFDLGRGEIRPSLLSSAPIELRIAAVPHLPEIVATLKRDMLQAVNIAEGAAKPDPTPSTSMATLPEEGQTEKLQELHRGHGCGLDPEAEVDDNKDGGNDDEGEDGDGNSGLH